ncbi:hypothetical protein [Nannocystis exedens]|uniref:hypothetical protein n=1 Tax=Nannocystis exedens TaxID=54 RepID=UPI0011605FF9|nr:hypothetical protein [Nannocystis exedens]
MLAPTPAQAIRPCTRGPRDGRFTSTRASGRAIRQCSRADHGAIRQYKRPATGRAIRQRTRVPTSLPSLGDAQHAAAARAVEAHTAWAIAELAARRGASDLAAARTTVAIVTITGALFDVRDATRRPGRGSAPSCGEPTSRANSSVPVQDGRDRRGGHRPIGGS